MSVFTPHHVARPAVPPGLLALMLGGLAAVSAPAQSDDPGASATLRVSVRMAFSSEVFSDVNENDARAAIKVWTRTLAQQHNIEMSPEPMFLRSRDAVVAAFRNNHLDACALTLLEFAALGELADPHEIFCSTYEGVVVERYVLLVPAEGGPINVAGLRGRKLLVQRDARSILGPVWLDVLLAERGLDRANGFLGEFKPETKLTRVVLPVFFGQADACLVTRRGLDNMIELNPQLGRRLRVLETSPPVVPGMFCFRRGVDTLARKRLTEAITGLNQSPAGQQMLTLFQTSKIEVQSAEVLTSSLALLEQHRRLVPASKRPGATLSTR